MTKNVLLILFLLTSIVCVPLCAQSVSDVPEDDESVNYEPSEIIDDTTHSGHEGHAHSDTTSIAKKEGGSANRGINFLYYENVLNTGMPVLQFVDTIAHNVHRYRPIEKGDIFRTDRGNYGMITQETEYNPTFSINRTFGHSPYELYRFSPENSPFYQGRNPYAEIFYIFGLSKDQYFHGLFTMNLWRGLNVGGQYRAIASPGRYSHQRSSHNNARFLSITFPEINAIPAKSPIISTNSN
ncbi:hypothetical protein FACS1894178_8240 [Bacteroidia bacterium]|nr:hypothetical protein FACS1894178_8240 [Bacteroidia bacterium]